LLDLGRELVEMSPKTLAALALDADLRNEIEFARGIRAHVARKRHLQFIAKMLRHRDTEALRSAMDANRLEARQLVGRHHRAEAWRDLLLATGDDALSGFLDQYGSADAQALRQLIRNAQREARLDKPPSSARKLFRHLRDLDAKHPLPPAPGEH
jgi:ribosome-associated protein